MYENMSEFERATAKIDAWDAYEAAKRMVRAAYIHDADFAESRGDAAAANELIAKQTALMTTPEPDYDDIESV